MRMKKMTKQRGYTILALLILGTIFFFLSISSILLFAGAVICFAGAVALYKLHLKSGGMTVTQALKKNGERT
jgi:uncharacterized metal-binding protein